MNLRHQYLKSETWNSQVEQGKDEKEGLFFFYIFGMRRMIAIKHWWTFTVFLFKEKKSHWFPNIETAPLIWSYNF